MRWQSRWSLMLGMVVFCVVLGLNVFRTRGGLQSLRNLDPLRTALLRTEGWSLKDAPLADSPEAESIVRNILKYDKVLNITCSKGGKLVDIYVAYWGADRVSAKSVQAHVPDVCWPAVGWAREDVGAGAERLTLPEWLQGAEYRVFQQRHHRVEVVYWHIIGGRMTKIEPERKRGSEFLADIAHPSRLSRGEQFLVRISTPQTLDAVTSSELMANFFAALRTVVSDGG